MASFAAAISTAVFPAAILKEFEYIYTFSKFIVFIVNLHH